MVGRAIDWHRSRLPQLAGAHGLSPDAPTRGCTAGQTLKEAVERVQSWPDLPCVRVLTPTDQHWTLLQQMLRAGNATANLVSDAHLAALAMEHNCVLHSTDADFARFRGLKWRNPLAA